MQVCVHACMQVEVCFDRTLIPCFVMGCAKNIFKNIKEYIIIIITMVTVTGIISHGHCD